MLAQPGAASISCSTTRNKALARFVRWAVPSHCQLQRTTSATKTKFVARASNWPLSVAHLPFQICRRRRRTWWDTRTSACIASARHCIRRVLCQRQYHAFQVGRNPEPRVWLGLCNQRRSLGWTMFCVLVLRYDQDRVVRDFAQRRLF